MSELTQEIEKEEGMYVYDKKIECPVCMKEFTTKIVKTGKARFKGSEMDLRPAHPEREQIGYDEFGLYAVHAVFHQQHDTGRCLGQGDLFVLPGTHEAYSQDRIFSGQQTKEAANAAVLPLRTAVPHGVYTAGTWPVISEKGADYGKKSALYGHHQSGGVRCRGELQNLQANGMLSERRLPGKALPLSDGQNRTEKDQFSFLWEQPDTEPCFDTGVSGCRPALHPLFLLGSQSDSPVKEPQTSVSASENFRGDPHVSV